MTARPTTESEWRQVIRRAAAHPDAGGDHEAFIALMQQRQEWRKTHRHCHGCGVVMVNPRTRQRFHSAQCATVHRPTQPKRLRAPRIEKPQPVPVQRPPVVLSDRHDVHAAAFGPFRTCAHPACVRDRQLIRKEAKHAA